MISCRFSIPSEVLSEFELFSEVEELDNVSVFENAASGFSDRLDKNGFPIANFFDVEILFPNEQAVRNFESKLKSRFPDHVHNFQFSVLKDEDWVDLYTRSLTPVICECFYFYDENVQQNTADGNLIPIKLNSALAFGSGHHQTTQCCIRNILHLHKFGVSPATILDMGCGTGILGICTMKIWTGSELLGIDIDPEAVRISKENYRINGVAADAIVGCRVDGTSRFGLILCNILKQPLIDLCPEFRKSLTAGGYIITSGFITSQECEIVECYENVGFSVENRIQADEWLSITFRKND